MPNPWGGISDALYKLGGSLEDRRARKRQEEQDEINRKRQEAADQRAVEQHLISLANSKRNTDLGAADDYTSGFREEPIDMGTPPAPERAGQMSSEERRVGKEGRSR